MKGRSLFVVLDKSANLYIPALCGSRWRNDVNLQAAYSGLAGLAPKQLCFVKWRQNITATWGLQPRRRDRTFEHATRHFFETELTLIFGLRKGEPISR